MRFSYFVADFRTEIYDSINTLCSIHDYYFNLTCSVVSGPVCLLLSSCFGVSWIFWSLCQLTCRVDNCSVYAESCMTVLANGICWQMVKSRKFTGSEPNAKYHLHDVQLSLSVVLLAVYSVKIVLVPRWPSWDQQYLRCHVTMSVLSRCSQRNLLQASASCIFRYPYDTVHTAFG